MSAWTLAIITLILIIIWDLLGQLGFSIWCTIFISQSDKPERPEEFVNLGSTLLSKHKIKFRIAGPAGLIYALNYKGKKK
jgi:hypothetical protein